MKKIKIEKQHISLIIIGVIILLSIFLYQKNQMRNNCINSCFENSLNRKFSIISTEDHFNYCKKICK